MTVAALSQFYYIAMFEGHQECKAIYFEEYVPMPKVEVFIVETAFSQSQSSFYFLYAPSMIVFILLVRLYDIAFGILSCNQGRQLDIADCR